MHPGVSKSLTNSVGRDFCGGLGLQTIPHLEIHGLKCKAALRSVAAWLRRCGVLVEIFRGGISLNIALFSSIATHCVCFMR